MVINTLRWTTRDLDAMPDEGGWKRYEIICAAPACQYAFGRRQADLTVVARV
ncbi:MAG: hypothetical protein AAF921_01195 [Cyanobacteria bacterium P01_D01_bin.44]